ncbi:hypothetical protein D3C84_738410 [compost metagenome]
MGLLVLGMSNYNLRTNPWSSAKEARMKLSLIVLSGAVAMALGGCATASKTYTSDGREGFSIDCSGSALSWGKCYEKAGELCGARGYDLLEKSGDQGSTVAANQFGLYGGSVMSRSMVIACK